MYNTNCSYLLYLYMEYKYLLFVHFLHNLIKFVHVITFCVSVTIFLNNTLLLMVRHRSHAMSQFLTFLYVSTIYFAHYLCSTWICHFHLKFHFHVVIQQEVYELILTVMHDLFMSRKSKYHTINYQLNIPQNFSSWTFITKMVEFQSIDYLKKHLDI